MSSRNHPRNYTSVGIACQSGVRPRTTTSPGKPNRRTTTGSWLSSLNSIHTRRSSSTKSTAVSAAIPINAYRSIVLSSRPSLRAIDMSGPQVLSWRGAASQSMRGLPSAVNEVAAGSTSAVVRRQRRRLSPHCELSPETRDQSTLRPAGRRAWQRRSNSRWVVP